MGKRLTFTFALTGRRNGEHGTRGVAPGYELAGLSARTEPQMGFFRTTIPFAFRIILPIKCRQMGNNV